jgi:CubicO group peptidase (beta-lactamase class C family)
MEWEQLVAMMPYMRLAFRPGERYSYSNPAFVYVARAIEEFGLDSWEGQIYKSYFLPLGMTASYFGHTPRHLMEWRSHNFSVGREGVTNNGPDFHPGATIPNGGWNAPVTDITRWLHLLAGDPDSATQARFNQIVDRSTVEEMWQPVVRVNAEEEMGLSFFLRTENGQKLVGHTGTQANFRSFFWLNPDTRMAVIGVVNTSNDVDGARSSAGFNEVMAAARKVVSR